MNGETGNQYINLYFFKNGSLRKPEKIRRRKNEIEKLVSKKGKYCYYHDKIIYTICAEPVVTLSKFVNNSPFVLVEPEDSFKPQKYSQLYNELMQEMSNNQYETSSKRSSCSNASKKSRSSPAIPTIRSETSVKFCPISEDDSSDEEICQESISSIKRKAPPSRSSIKSQKEPQEQPKKTKKKGIFANCCVKAQPSLNPPQPFIACNNDKITQTTAADFKCAMVRLERENQEQKKREKIYKKAPIPKKGSIPPYCPRDDSDDECVDPKILDQIEAARNEFFKKRNAMATKIKKSLDKKYCIEEKHGEC